ncbi:hypothetical protein EPN29_06155 [bacterium]|nr:MAG: hypothetical protein EPN29_06155 [bacterium]
MLFWTLAVLQWLHVFFAIFWFGSVLTIDFLIVPTLQSLPAEVQHAFGGALGRRAPKLITPVAGAVILLGILRGIAGGVLGNLGSAYGASWIASLLLAVGLMSFGLRVITPAVEKLQRTPQGAEFVAAVNRVKGLTLAELGGFLLIISFMIAMRFGY